VDPYQCTGVPGIIQGLKLGFLKVHTSTCTAGQMISGTTEIIGAIDGFWGLARQVTGAGYRLATSTIRSQSHIVNNSGARKSALFLS
jgi:hypothetical protein